MEIAGDNCKFCDQPFLSEADAAVCRHCQTRFHSVCLEEAQCVCPQCGEACNHASEIVAETAHGPALHFPEGQFQRLKPSALYRFSLVIVSCAMLLLPLLYVGLAALFVFGVAAYAVHYSNLLNLAQYGLIVWFVGVMAYTAPLLVGLIMPLFLIKPLFAPRRAEEKAYSLNFADAPQLFALVGWICRSLEAPIPSRIDVDCKVNASAGFRSGWRSLFGNDIILVIGLPLVAGMDLAQFAGVLAHEYGHFSQGAAMRSAYLIQKINAWFYRLVYERDNWDLGLELASEQEDQPVLMFLLLHLARFLVWLTRQLLWLFMAAGLALSCFMSRQMEFDADRYQVQFCGSENFAFILRRALQLNLGSNEAIKLIREKWTKERKLFDQIPEFIVSRANEITAEAQEKMHAALLQRRPTLFDTHPSDAERIARTAAAREPGLFHSTLPATSLFADFAELSRRMTLNYYQGVFGRQIPAERLISTQQVTAREEHDYAADRAQIERYFLGLATDLRPVILAENKSLLVLKQENLLAELQACRSEMAAARATAEPAFAEFIYWEKCLLQAAQAAHLLQAGFQFDPTDFGMGDNDIENALATARAALASANEVLRPFENAGRTRLMHAVQLLRLPRIAAQIPDATKLQDEAKAMIWVLSRLGEAFEPLLELRQLSATLEVLLAHRREQPAADNVAPVLENLCMEIQERVNFIQGKTALIRYPFHHATDQVMVSEYARNKTYHADPYELALREGQSHTEKLLNLYARVLASLVLIAEEVERRVAA